MFTSKDKMKYVYDSSGGVKLYTYVIHVSEVHILRVILAYLIS